MFPCSYRGAFLSGLLVLLCARAGLSAQGKPALAPASGSATLGADFPAIVTAPDLDLGGGFLQSNSEFGRAATELGDLDGDGVQDLAVGVPGFDFNRGAVALFVGRSPLGRPRHFLGQESGGFEGSLAASGRFGAALASLDDLDGDGIRELAVGNPSSNTVWILFLDAEGLVREERALTFGGFNDRFGGALATLGDLDGDGLAELAAGVPGEDDGGTDQGSVLILFLNPDGSLRSQLSISEISGGFGGTLDFGDEFGGALANAGDLDGDGVEDLLVGAPLDDVGPGNAGSVWLLFLQPGGTVRSFARIFSPAAGTPAVNDGFGSAVAGLGDLDGDGTHELAVGIPRDDDGGGDRGAVWIFSVDGTGTVLTSRKFSPTSGGFVGPLADGDQFGSALARLQDRDGDGNRDLFVGAPFGENGTCSNTGEGWFLLLGTSGERLGERRGGGDCIVVPKNARYGGALADLGDMDGNGTRELAVGCPFELKGRVRLLSLNSDGSLDTHLTLDSLFSENGGRFGSALANLGDMDGDGRVELAVGVPNSQEFFTPPQSGGVWILTLQANGVVARRTRVNSPIAPRSRFGRALAALEDMDGNGVGELAVGMPGLDEGGQNAGGLQIVRLDSAGVAIGRTTIDGSSLPLLSAGDRFGSALAALGDLDGDGVGELAVGTPGFDGGFDDRGQVWILFLRLNGQVRAHQRISTNQGGFSGLLNTGDRFGTALTALPDLDGDGVAELLVGAPGDDGSGRNAGILWALFLASDGSVKSARKLGPGLGFPAEVGEGAGFGSALGTLADLNGDGRPEFAVGAPLDDRVLPNAGMAWVALLGGAGRITFQTEDDLVTPLFDGQALSSPPHFGQLFRLSASGVNLGPAIFDSSPGGPNDPSQDLDLLVDKGNVLILQNSLSSAQSVPGFFDRPNDAPDGGILRFEFVVPQELLSLDLIDIDRASARFAYVRLTDTSGSWREYTVPPGWTEDVASEGAPGWRTLSLTTLAPQPGAYAVATAAQLSGFDGTEVQLLVVQLDGSGAVDELRFETESD